MKSRAPLLLAAVFAIKSIVVLQLDDHPLTQATAGLDTSVYVNLAAQLAAGNYLLGPGLYFVSPLYIYFLAVVLATTKSLTAVRLIQIALGTAAVGAIFVASREWFGARAGWIAASLAALTGLFTFYEALLLQAALDPFLTAFGLAALALALNRGRSAGWFFAGGALFGLQTLNRPNVLIPAIAICAVLAVTRRLRPAALLAAGLAAALAPVTLRNVVVAGNWSPVSSHGGLNFYIGNNADADGTYHHVPGITPDIAGQQTDAKHVAEQAAGRTLNDADVSAYFYGLGWQWIRGHPRDAAALFARKLAYAFSGAQIALNYSYPFYAYDARTLLALLAVGLWLLIPLGVFGFVAAAPRDRRIEYFTWLSFVPLYAISVAIFFVADRYRIPLLVAMCIGAGAAVDWWWRRVSFRGFRVQPEGLAAVVLVALFIFVNWPSRLDDGRAEERTRMAEAMVASGHDDEAEVWTKKAEQHNPQAGLVHFRVGRLFLAQHKPAAALPHLQQALTLDPNRPEIEYALGQTLLDLGRPTEAVPHLRRALDARVRADLAGFDLARALAAAGDRAGALDVLKDVRPSNPADAASWSALGQLAMELQSPPLAAMFFDRSVAAAPNAARPRQDLGLALAMMGRNQEAIASFEQAVRLDPADPAAQLNLAVAYAQAGRIADARAHAEEALRLQPDYVRAREFLTALKEGSSQEIKRSREN